MTSTSTPSNDPLSEAKNWLGNSETVKDFEVVRVEEGEGNYNLVIDSDRRYVLRVSKEISSERLENEYRCLKFLTSNGVEFVPEPVEFGREKRVCLLETFIPGDALEKDDFTPERTRALARKVAKIHSLPQDSFPGEGEPGEVKLEEVYRADFRKYSENPYRKYMEIVDEPDDRIEHYFELQKELVEQIDGTVVKKTVIHGDLSSNILAGDAGISIVDWEFSRIGYPGHEILYFFEHQELETAQRDTFLDEYRRQRQLGDGFQITRETYPKFLAFNDMIWAAVREARTGEEKYRELLEERIDRLDRIYRE